MLSPPCNCLCRINIHSQVHNIVNNVVGKIILNTARADWLESVNILGNL